MKCARRRADFSRREWLRLQRVRDEQAATFKRLVELIDEERLLESRIQRMRRTVHDENQREP